MGRIQQLDKAGYVVVKGALDEDALEPLRKACDVTDEKPHIRRHAQVYGIRNLLEEIPEVRELAGSKPVRRLVESVLGKGAFCVRGIFFDKPADANWQVPWHQDVFVAVADRAEAPGFTAWSLKAGVHHVQPPVRLLEHMVTARVHLDHCDAENGALQVLPGSHSHGRLDSKAVRAWRREHEPIYCEAEAGDIMLMRPLLVHCSDSAKHACHRRVIHLEYAAEALPDPLAWHDHVA